MLRYYFRAAGIISAMVMASIGNTFAAPVTFNTALPVGGGEFVARGQVVLNQSGHDPTVAARDLTTTFLVSVLGYGIDHKLAVFAVLPYADKEMSVSIAGNRLHRGSSGLSDLRMFGRYTIVQRDRPGETFRVAPFVGITAPTGSDDVTDERGRLPSSLQPGTGAWNTFAGIIMTYQTFALQADGQLSYRLNNEANSIDPGDEIRLDGSLQYRLWPNALGKGVPSFLYGVLEANLFYRDKNQVSGIEDDDSGGTSLYLSPGLQFVTRRWIVEGIVQFPVMQNLHGTALEGDYALRLGFRLNF